MEVVEDDYKVPLGTSPSGSRVYPPLSRLSARIGRGFETAHKAQITPILFKIEPFCALRYSETSAAQLKCRDSHVLNYPNSHRKRPNGSRNPLLAPQLPFYSGDLRFA